MGEKHHLLDCRLAAYQTLPTHRGDSQSRRRHVVDIGPAEPSRASAPGTLNVCDLGEVMKTAIGRSSTRHCKQVLELRPVCPVKLSPLAEPGPAMSGFLCPRAGRNGHLMSSPSTSTIHRPPLNRNISLGSKARSAHSPPTQGDVVRLVYWSHVRAPLFGVLLPKTHTRLMQAETVRHQWGWEALRNPIGP